MSRGVGATDHGMEGCRGHWETFDQPAEREAISGIVGPRRLLWGVIRDRYLITPAPANPDAAQLDGARGGPARKLGLAPGRNGQDQRASLASFLSTPFWLRVD
jgi:hypothetical protein